MREFSENLTSGELLSLTGYVSKREIEYGRNILIDLNRDKAYRL